MSEGAGGPMRIPMPALVVLAGPPGSGKSTWARRWFADCTVSSDDLRALVGESDKDQRASGAAFDLLHQAVDARLARGLPVVVDTMGIDADDRRRWVEAARRAGLPVLAVAFDVTPKLAKARNAARARRVPAAAMTKLLKQWPDHRQALAHDGFDAVHVTDGSAPVVRVPSALVGAHAAARAQAEEPVDLRFGLHVSAFEWPGGSDAIAPTLRAVAETAEQIGFASLRVLDHPMQIPQVGRAWDAMLEPFATLAHVSAVTERLRLGPLVAGVTYRNIGLLGKTVATLDVLSGGRAELGLGLAWYERDHRAYGYELPPVRRRAALLEDALRFLPALWGPGTPPFEGRTFSTPEAVCYPRPLQDRVPIIVGGQGERTTLRLAAALADGCNLFGDVDTVRHKVAIVHDHARAADRDPAEVAVTHLSTSLVGRDAGELERLVQAHGPSSGAVAWRSSVNAATIDDHIGRFRLLADAGVQEAIVVLPDLEGPEALERFAPVIEAFSR